MAAGLVIFAEYWLIIGAVVAAVFVIFGIDRIDEDARGAYVVRPLRVPGGLQIWPRVLWRWYVLETGRADEGERYRAVRSSYGAMAVGMAVAIAVVISLGFGVKQSWPDHIAPERLSEGTQ